MSTFPYDEMIESLFPSILEILRKNPGGVTEYDLIRLLQEEEGSPVRGYNFQDTLSLFQLHFILFHTLYRLRDQLLRSGESDLSIQCMKIILTPCPHTSGGDHLTRPEPMREYYLNRDNLEQTGKREVDEMLKSFWNRFDLHKNRNSALETLGLQDPVDYETIKRRYRELALEHHPDRGGDQESLLVINEAMETLHRFYQH